MNRFGLIAGLAILVLPTGAMSANQHVMLQPESLEWTAAPPVLPKGAQGATARQSVGEPADRELAVSCAGRFGNAVDATTFLFG